VQELIGLIYKTHTMKKIIVAYWHLGKFSDLKYEHNQEFDYSVRKRNQIIDDILSKGYSVMLRPMKTEPTLVIWIDDYRFGQR